MNHIFLSQAKDEYRDAVTWYELQRSGLGDEFSEEVENAIAKLKENPKTWQSFPKGGHRYRMMRFPYDIVYLVDADEIFIVAIGHLSRRPGYWKSRLK